MRITSSNVLHQPKGLQGTSFRRYNPCTAVMSLRHRRRGVEGEAGRQRRRTCGLSCFLTSSRLELFLGFLLFLQLHLVSKFLLHSERLRFVSSSRHRHLAQSRLPLSVSLSAQTCTQERALMSESALETPCGRDGIVGAVHRVRALAQLEFASSRPCSTCLQSCQLRPIQNLSPTDAATDKKTSIKLGHVFSISLLCSIASVCVALRLRSLLFPQPVYVASRYF